MLLSWGLGNRACKQSGRKPGVWIGVLIFKLQPWNMKICNSTLCIQQRPHVLYSPTLQCKARISTCSNQVCPLDSYRNSLNGAHQIQYRSNFSSNDFDRHGNCIHPRTLQHIYADTKGITQYGITMPSRLAFWGSLDLLMFQFTYIQDHHKALQYDMILHTALKWLMQIKKVKNQSLN